MAKDKIKITITVERHVAEAIESSLEKFIGCEGEPENDDTELLKSLRKAQLVFGRAIQRNKGLTQ